MKKNSKGLTAGLLALVLTGCVRPYDTPEFVTIEPSQTAFLIPLDASQEQQQLASEEFLKRAQVATKRLQIAHRWIQEGRMSSTGKFIPTVRVVVVERKPISREWTASSTTGTSTKNEGIVAESKESIGFVASMNCSAQVEESDAAKFLYRYNSKALSDVMDTELRAMVESIFVEECAKLNLDQIWLNKEKIMNTVRSKSFPYFKERGVTITVLGLKGELKYTSEEIQKSIDARFTAAQELRTQRDVNQRSLEKARADAQAARIVASSGNREMQWKSMDHQLKMRAIERWNGQLPVAVGSGNLLNLSQELLAPKESK